MTKNKISFYILTGIVLILLLLAGISSYTTKKSLNPVPGVPMPRTPAATSETPNALPNIKDNAQQTTNTLPFTLPLDRAKERVTKKPFGIHISPSNSPVSPEKFTGIHTGTDFEAFPEEADTDVEVKTICSGPLLRKQQARGYGGMVVQACTLDGNAITVVYGHVKLESVSAEVNEPLDQGATLSLLGKGYSTETDGERKHLHLGVHKGSQVVTNGYITNQADLKNWLDVMQYLK